MEWIKAKTILAKTNYGAEWYGIDYQMNLYRGCSHGCIYCDSRSNCYRIENFDIVRGKEHTLQILEKELSQKRKIGVIGIGSMSDPYNPKERQYEITRNALKLIQKYNFGVSIDTKSDFILRDIDLLKEIQKSNSVIVKFTITTSDDELSKIIEPHVCNSTRRFAAIKKLSEEGIYTGIMLNPVLPFLTDSDENIKKIVKLAHENGAKFIHTYLGMTLRENQRDYYYEKLDQHFPHLKEQYQKRYGFQYNCPIPNIQQKFKLFQTECEKYHILYDMKEIIKDYKKEIIQINLFDLEKDSVKESKKA